jgi:PAS domain S-box-containing protein
LKTKADNYQKAGPRQQPKLGTQSDALLDTKPEDIEKMAFKDIKAMIHELQQIKTRYKIQFLGSPTPTITWQRIEDKFKMIDYNFAAVSFTGSKVSKYSGKIAGEFYKNRPDILADLDRCFKEKTIVKRKTSYQMITTGEERDLILTLAFVPPDLILQYFEDLTDYIQAEKVLAESEAKYHQLFENESDAVMVFDAETRRFEDVNKATLDLYGYSKEEFLKLTLEDIFTDKAGTRIAVQRLEEAEPGSNRLPLRYFRKKDGTIFPGEIAIGKFISGGQKKTIGAVRDVTGREQAHKKLKESEERYRSLVDNIAIGVTFISPNMEILTLNNQMRRWYPDLDLSKNPRCYSAFNDPPRDKICSYCPTFKTLKDGQVHEAITETPAGNEIRNYRIISSPVKDYEGNIVAAIEMVEDITERRRTEAHIQNLSHQLLRAQENERQMFSSELHDTVAQDLSSLKIGLKTLFNKQQNAFLGTGQKISELSKIVDRSIVTVRNLSHDLRPPGMDEIGLLQTLCTYCEDFAENTGIKVKFHATGLKNVTMGSFTEINLYRLIQEGLINIRKHADATRATINLVGAHPNIILLIEDDGKGFDVQARELIVGSEKRLGLRSMQARTGMLQGQMTVLSRPMKGTKILIKFPVKENRGES